MESPDTVHGRLLESTKISGYSFDRAMEQLEWLLEEERWRAVGDGYERIGDFLATIDLSPFNLSAEQRQPLARKISELGASEREIAAPLGVSPSTAHRDLASAPSEAEEEADTSPDQEEQEPTPGLTAPSEADTSPDQEEQADQPAPEPPKPQPTITLYTHEGIAVEYPEPKGRVSFNNSPGEGISWATWSWNPVTGCLHGCKYCYARELANSERLARSYPAGFTPLFHHERLDAPANTTIPTQHADDPAWRRVFVCSMADLYGRWVPDEWIDKVHASMLASPEWEYILLTKFPSRYNKVELPASAWVGTSVDEQRRVPLAEDAFRKISGVKVKWLSLEPLLAPLEFTDLSMFDWVVIGAQTETRQPDGIVPAFQPPWNWVLDITQQAREAGCKVHWKPNLHHGPGMTWPNEYPVA